MTAPDIAAIARSLTKAQREAVQYAWRSVTGVMMVSDVASSRTIVALEDAGLIAQYSLTSLGLRVRAHLLETTHV